jgi:hypothetical protein
MAAGWPIDCQTLYMTFEGADPLCANVDWCRISGTATYDPSEAATYYVAPYGNGGNDGLSVTTAFKTIQKAATVMKPGSICNIRQGVYRETVTPRYTGLPSARILLGCYHCKTGSGYRRVGPEHNVYRGAS